MAQRSRGYARGHSNTTTAVRGAGIRKRSPQPPRMERDGDLIMDGAGDSRGRPRGGNRGPYQSNRGGPSRNTINTNALSRAISSGDRNNNMILREGSRNNPIRSQRANHRKPERSAWDELTVRGWKQSAAVDNEDHGISKLITFINKKASRNDSDILVQQVSPQSVLADYQCNSSHIFNGPLSFRAKLSERRPIYPAYITATYG